MTEKLKDAIATLVAVAQMEENENEVVANKLQTTLTLDDVVLTGDLTNSQVNAMIELLDYLANNLGIEVSVRTK